MQPEFRKVCFLSAWAGAGAILLLAAGTVLGLFRGTSIHRGPLGDLVSAHLFLGISDHPETGTPIFVAACFALGATLWAIRNASRSPDQFRGTLSQLLFPARVAFGLTAVLLAMTLVLAGTRILLTQGPDAGQWFNWGHRPWRDQYFIRSTFRSGLALAILCFGLSLAAWIVTTLRAVKILDRRSRSCSGRPGACPADGGSRPWSRTRPGPGGP